MTNFKPMLAASLVDYSTLRLPAYASDKEDGVRCMLMESHKTGKRIAYSRTLKPIPNLYIRRTLEQSSLPLGIDGELIVGDNFQDTASGVMSVGGEPNFRYRVFDYFGDSLDAPFYCRLEMLKTICADNKHLPWLELLPQKLITTLEELNIFEQEALARSKEGVMLRAPEGKYKCGRSTLSQQWLLKLKRFSDADAVVVGFEELMHNDNAETSNAMGYSERSSHQDSMIPGDTLGALICRHHDTRTIFNIGTGFTAAARKEIWINRDRYLNKTVTYKYQPFGVKVAPRSPVFLRWKLDAKL